MFLGLQFWMQEWRRASLEKSVNYFSLLCEFYVWHCFDTSHTCCMHVALHIDAWYACFPSPDVSWWPFLGETYGRPYLLVGSSFLDTNTCPWSGEYKEQEYVFSRQFGDLKAYHTFLCHAALRIFIRSQKVLKCCPKWLRFRDSLSHVPIYVLMHVYIHSES